MAPNVILIDAAYIDRVAADFRTHFGAELGRPLPKADLAQWLVCMALDAFTVETQTTDRTLGEVQVCLLHDREMQVMQHVVPSHFGQEIDGKAFAEPELGEFAMACCPVERVTTLNDLCGESLEALLEDKQVKRIAVVYDFDGVTAESRSLIKRITRVCQKHAATEESKDITLFTMKPLEGDGFSQQILGYSLLAALGISGDEM